MQHVFFPFLDDSTDALCEDMTVLRKPRGLARLRKEMIAVHAVFVNFSIYTGIMLKRIRHFSARSSEWKMYVQGRHLIAKSIN